jgi:hypothetical protein
MNEIKGDKNNNYGAQSISSLAAALCSLVLQSKGFTSIKEGFSQSEHTIDDAITRDIARFILYASSPTSMVGPDEINAFALSIIPRLAPQFMKHLMLYCIFVVLLLGFVYYTRT